MPERAPARARFGSRAHPDDPRPAPRSVFRPQRITTSDASVPSLPASRASPASAEEKAGIEKFKRPANASGEDGIPCGTDPAG